MTKLSKFTINTPEDQEIHEFFKRLDDKSITDATRKHIVEMLHKYKDLLMSTLNELQRQRLNRNILSSDLDNLIFFMSPDSNSVEEALDELLRDADDVEKQLRFRDWAKDNINDFKNKLEKVSNTRKDEELQKEWGEMQKDLMELLKQVKDDSEKAKKNGMFIGLVIVVVSVIAAVYPFTERPSSAALPLRFFGAGLCCAFGNFAMNGKIAIGSIFSPEPNTFQIIEKIQKEMTDIIHELETIKSHPCLDDIMLYLSLEENNGAVISSEKKFCFEKNTENFVTVLEASKKNIAKLVDHIKKTEVAVSSELDSFNERIYKPLLRRLYGSE